MKKMKTNKLLTLVLLFFAFLFVSGVSSWLIITQDTFNPVYVSKIILNVTQNEIVGIDYSSPLTVSGLKGEITTDPEFNPVFTHFNDDSQTEDLTGKYDILSTTITDGNSNTSNNDDIAVGSTYQCTVTISIKEEFTEEYQLNNSTVTFIVKYKTCQIEDIWTAGNTCYTIEDALAMASGNATSETIITAGASTSAQAQTSFTKLSNINNYLTLYADKTENLNNYSTNFAYSIESGDTLFVPDGVSSLSSDTPGYSLPSKDSDGSEGSNTVYSVLHIPSDVNLTVSNGSNLTVAAFLSQSSETQNRGVIINNGNITVTGGTVNSYGYIKGSQGKLILSENATATDVFRLYDFCGGALSSTMEGKNFFPMDSYSFHNISCAMTVNHGCKYSALYYLNMASTNIYNTIYLISSTESDSPLFYLTSGYIEKSVKFNKSNDNDNPTVRNTRPSEQKEQIKIYGTATDCSVSITVKVLLFETEIKTSTDMALPLSLMDIVIGEGSELTLKTNSYKVFPGSSITIEENAKLYVNDKVKVMLYDEDSYKDYCSTSKVGIQAHSEDGTSYKVPNGSADAYVKNNGYLQFNSGSYVGGNIITEVDDATLVLNGNVTCSMLRLTECYYTSSTNYAANVSEGIVSPATGDVLYTSQSQGKNVIEDKNLESGRTYRSKGNYWLQNRDITVTINMGGGTATKTENCLNGVVINSSDYTIPENYKMVGSTLHFDENCSGDFPYKIGTDKIYSDITLYMDTNYDGYLIKFLTDGGTAIINVKLSKDNLNYNLSNATTTKAGYDLTGWKFGDTLLALDAVIDSSYFAEGNYIVSIYAVWEISSYTLTLTKDTGVESMIPSIDSSTLTANSDGTYDVEYGKTVTITVAYKSNYKYDSSTIADWVQKNSDTQFIITMPAENVTFTVKGKNNSCITPETLITLADGSQVEVQHLKGDEELLVWNMYTGKFDSAPLIFVMTHEESLYNVVYLTFSDNTVVKVIYEHGFYCYDTNSYIYLDSNASEYIGYTFDKMGQAVTLVDVEIVQEYTKPYSPLTNVHLCYYVNGLLSTGADMEGLIGIFTVDPDTMTYDKELMEQDIATYGLFTYEEFIEVIGIEAFPESMFNAYQGQYLKVSIGKGLITVEKLKQLIETYTEYLIGS